MFSKLDKIILTYNHAAPGCLLDFSVECSSLKSSVKPSGFVSAVLPQHTYSAGQGLRKGHTGQTRTVFTCVCVLCITLEVRVYTVRLIVFIVTIDCGINNDALKPLTTTEIFYEH